LDAFEPEGGKARPKAVAATIRLLVEDAIKTSPERVLTPEGRIVQDRIGADRLDDLGWNGQRIVGQRGLTAGCG
jgi:hypothetical protein